MIPAVFINCDRFPFIDWIMARRSRKTDESRTRNMLRALVGQRVILAETRRGRRPVARCYAVIRSAQAVRSREEWDSLRRRHRVPAGSAYDWQPDTRIKWLYELTDVVPVHPFPLPDGVRHGRVWMEYIEEEETT